MRATLARICRLLTKGSTGAARATLPAANGAAASA
jgi:hypothetical protein